ncbi:TetR/AcrR family transcriptional regulator [Deinococcus multiflagellatus]|uniref:TetR/AcrR family transcriptional regulator n=1 Tax=Deinococcus multiflagellatus TaxID=1656887 RepID=UPI001CCD71DA|nr:TetR/AcrR family transcriptional regulator [Deinococcus multiflagellatus]MBZ9712923.1 TetR/AcrR family transcriptional regulator [Deinococcus multiflagellatus]
MPYPAKLTPEAIQAAAWALLEQGGPAALGMRPLAEALGVRPSSLYRHVGSREALLTTLAEQAASALRTELTAAAGLPPRAALAAVAQAYWHFARTRPHAYDLLLTPVAPGAPGLWTPAGKALWGALLERVGALTGHPDDTGHAVAYWTFLHGAAALERAGLYGQSGPQGGVEIGLGALLDQMEAAGHLSSRAAGAPA